MEEKIMDVTTSEYVSKCCGSPVYMPTKDWAKCLDCLEECDVERVYQCEFCKDDPSVTFHDENGEVPCHCVLEAQADRDLDSRIMMACGK